MKSNSTKVNYSKNLNVPELIVHFIVISIAAISMRFLCDVMGLDKFVLLAASIISVGNAVYYGVFWKDLKKSMRLGLAIFFSLIGLVGFMFYKLLPQTDIATGWSMGQSFGFFVGYITFIFIYKHKTPKFWNQV